MLSSLNSVCAQGGAMSEGGASASPRKGFLRRRVAELLTGTLLLAVTALSSVQIWIVYERYLEASEHEAIYQATALADLAGERLVAVSEGLDTLIDRRAFAIGGSEAGSMASRALARLPEVKQFIAYDGEGRVAWAFAPARDRDFVSPIKPEFVLDHMAAPSITSEVGVPIDVGEGRRLLPVSRALLDQDGRLRGVVAALIDASLIEAALAHLEEPVDVAPEGALVLTRSGVVLAAHPANTVAIGTSVAGAPSFREHLGARREGVYRSVMDREGKVRLVAHRVAEPGYLIVTASIVRNPFQEALLPAARVWGSLVLATALVCIAIVIARRRRVRSSGAGARRATLGHSPAE